MKKSALIVHEPSEADIQHQAYLLWLEGGCRPGGELDDWHAAKEILRHRHHIATGKMHRAKIVAPVGQAAR